MIAASIGLLIAATGTFVLSGLNDVFFYLACLLAITAAATGIVGMIAAGVSIGVRHARVLEAESFTSAK